MDSQERFENMVGLVEAHQYEWAIWQAAARQEPDTSVVKRIATQMGWTPPWENKPIYQIRNASGAWTDIRESFYRILNDGESLFKTRIVYEVHLERPVCDCAPNVTGEACEKCYGAAPTPERAQESAGVRHVIDAQTERNIKNAVRNYWGDGSAEYEETVALLAANKEPKP